MTKISQKAENKTIIKGSGIVGILTLLSRVFGFLRDLAFARLFGASMQADAFFVAFKIPNMLRSFVAEGALTSAFVPLFAGEVKKGEKETKEAFRSVWGFLLVVTTILSIIGICFSEEITLFFAPGFEREVGKIPLANNLAKIMMPYIIFISFVSLANGALTIFKVFGMSAISQILMNIVMIAFALCGAYFLDPNSAVKLMAFSVIVAGFLMVLIQIKPLRKNGLPFLPSLKIFNSINITLVKLMAPAILGAGVYQLTIFVNTVLASMLESGSVSWLFYADRFSQIPIGIFTISLATVLLPSLSKYVVNNQQEEYQDCLKNALSYTSFVILPISFLIYAISEPCIQLFLERGAFNNNSTLNTASALKAYTIGIWGISCHTILIRAFLAKKDTKTPTVISLLMLLIHFHLSLLICGELSTGTSFSSKLLYNYQSFLGTYFNLGHNGLALSASISSTIGFAVLLFILRRREKGIDFSPFVKSSLKSFISALLMFLIINYVISLDINVILKLIVACALAPILYAFFSYLLKSKEFLQSYNLIKRKLIKQK